MDRFPTWPVAAGSLLLGFAVAQVTGVRPLGGVVLLAGLGWCMLRWRSDLTTSLVVLLVFVYAAAFALSHVLAHPLGPAAALAIIVLGVAATTWALADRTVRAPTPA